MWGKSGPRAIFIQGVAFQLGLDSVAFQEAEGQKGRKALLCVAFLGKSPLDCKQNQSAHPKEDQSWVFFVRNDAKAEAPVLWPPHAKS